MPIDRILKVNSTERRALNPSERIQGRIRMSWASGVAKLLKEGW